MQSTTRHRLAEDGEHLAAESSLRLRAVEKAVATAMIDAEISMAFGTYLLSMIQLARRYSEAVIVHDTVEVS